MECRHESWKLDSIRASSSGDYITIYVVCLECGLLGDFVREVQELADEFTEITWGMVPGLTIILTSNG